MLPTVSEKALRVLVAELAEATPEDIAAVLGMLAPRSRATVQSMLAAYTDFDGVFDLEIVAPAVDTPGLSDWLAARVQGHAADEDFRITPKTNEMLRLIVASAPPVSSAGRPGPHSRFEAVEA